GLGRLGAIGVPGIRAAFDKNNLVISIVLLGERGQRGLGTFFANVAREADADERKHFLASPCFRRRRLAALRQGAVPGGPTAFIVAERDRGSGRDCTAL